MKVAVRKPLEKPLVEAPTSPAKNKIKVHDDKKVEEVVLDIAAIPTHSVSVCISESLKVNNKWYLLYKLKAIEDLFKNVFVLILKVYMWGKIPEHTGKSVNEPWDTFMNSMSDVFSSFVMPPATYQPIMANQPSDFDFDNETLPDSVGRETIFPVIQL